MADSASRARAPRIERLTLWAIALDVVAVLAFLSLVLFLLVVPLATITALILSVRSAISARTLSAKLVAWATVLVTAVLVMAWVWGMHEIFFVPSSD